MRQALALVALLAGCAQQAAAPAPTTRWEFGRVQGPPPACYARLVDPSATQDFVQRADGAVVFALTPRNGRTVADLRGRPVPPAGAPFPELLTRETPQLGTVLQGTDQRLVVRVNDPPTLTAMLAAMEAESLKQVNARTPPNTVARLSDCLKTIQPAGASPQ
jgi:hypothetical protein